MGTAVSPSPDKPRLTHSLELEFNRVLTDQEWVEVIDASRHVPYVYSRVAHARNVDASWREDGEVEGTTT